MSTPSTTRPREPVDPGRSPIAPDDPRLGAWRAFLEAHARLARRLDEELRTAHGLSLQEYDALLMLATAPRRRLRMNQLADRVILSRSGITRLVDRLAADGLVERAHCPTDARGAEAVLTASGLARLRRAAPTHLSGIDRHFLTVVDPDDLPGLERSLGRVARAACAGDADPGACSPAIEDRASVTDPGT
jgi:DNA-binding MarR family transcriptional regulator